MPLLDCQKCDDITIRLDTLPALDEQTELVKQCCAL